VPFLLEVMGHCFFAHLVGPWFFFFSGEGPSPSPPFFGSLPQISLGLEDDYLATMSSDASGEE